MPISIGGKTYSDDEIRQFYANGGNDVQFAQQNGITDQNQLHDMAMQTRAIGGAPTGEAAARQVFQQYQKYNPNGANANSFEGWKNDQGAGTMSAINAGTYTGAATSPSDFAPGGIYYGRNINYKDNGLGPRGMGMENGGGWDTPGAASGSGGGGGNLGFGGGGGSGSSSLSTSTSASGEQNPYLKDMGQNIVTQMTDNFTRNQLPSLRSGAVAAGGFGGSRQGVVEANGLNDLNKSIGQNLTNLYGTDWTNQKNRDLQSKSMDNSYDLGLRSNNLGFANLDSNNQQFGSTFGLNVLNAQNNWANNGVNAANQLQQAPIDYNKYFNGQANITAGQGGGNSSTQQLPSNQWAGALGGYQIADSYLNPKR